MTKSLYECFIYPICFTCSEYVILKQFLNMFIHGNGIAPNGMDGPDSSLLLPLFLVTVVLESRLYFNRQNKHRSTKEEDG
jgi:hypothetical protein